MFGTISEYLPEISEDIPTVFECCRSYPKIGDGFKRQPRCVWRQWIRELNIRQGHLCAIWVFVKTESNLWLTRAWEICPYGRNRCFRPAGVRLAHNIWEFVGLLSKKLNSLSDCRRHSAVLLNSRRLSVTLVLVWAYTKWWRFGDYATLS